MGGASVRVLLSGLYWATMGSASVKILLYGLYQARCLVPVPLSESYYPDFGLYWGLRWVVPLSEGNAAADSWLLLLLDNTLSNIALAL